MSFNRLKSAPILLLLLSIFLIFISLLELNNFWLQGGGVDVIYKLRPALAITYTFLFIVATVYNKKFAFFGFVALSLLSWCIKVFYPQLDITKNILSVMQEPIPINIIFSMVLLVFYKQFK